MIKKKRVMVAMSGGVDSSVCVGLLLDQGYDVVGATMWLFDDQSPEIVADAKAVCDHFKIEHTVIDLRETFSRDVIEYFRSSYLAGLTPNPCAKCNRAIKFGALFEWMEKLDCDYLATGHYANIEKQENKYRLKRASTDRKDQAYFLHSIETHQLPYLLFPLGIYPDKQTIRQLAFNMGIPVASKKDSDGLCFTNGLDYRSYLEKLFSFENTKGFFIHENGKMLGKHDGYHRFTIGQKKNLGIEIEKSECVISINPKTNDVIIGDESLTYQSKLVIEDCSWIEKIEENHEYEVKMFNWGYHYKAGLSMYSDKSMLVTFAHPVRAIAPGQYLVVYDGDYVLGGGRIVSVVEQF